METIYPEDEERVLSDIPNLQECLLEFNRFLLRNNPDLNIDEILKKEQVIRNTAYSYGVVEFVKGEKSIYYHAFRKRHTTEYDIIIRGFSQKNELFNFLLLISQDERDRILNRDFKDVWDDYWIDHDENGYKRLEQQAKRKFYETKELLKIIDKYIPCRIKTRPLIFAKGRKNENENWSTAALREAEEETKVKYDSRDMYLRFPLEMNYLGSNGKKYRDIYYAVRRHKIYKSPVQNLGRRIRSYTIGHELESDLWIEIPIFASEKELLEWEESVDPFSQLGMFKRHFKILLRLHRLLV